MSNTLTDKELIDRCDKEVRHRRFIELAIIHRLIQDLTKAGYVVSYSDGEEEFENQNEQEGINTLFSVDDSLIYTKKNNSNNWISIIGGNGVDIISDYGIGLDPIISPIYAWIEEQEEAGTF